MNGLPQLCHSSRIWGSKGWNNDRERLISKSCLPFRRCCKKSSLACKMIREIGQNVTSLTCTAAHFRRAARSTVVVLDHQQYAGWIQPKRKKWIDHSSHTVLIDALFCAASAHMRPFEEGVGSFALWCDKSYHSRQRECIAISPAGGMGNRRWGRRGGSIHGRWRFGQRLVLL